MNSWPELVFASIVSAAGLVLIGVSIWLAFRPSSTSDGKATATPDGKGSDHVTLFASLGVALLLGGGIAVSGGISLEIGGGDKTDQCVEYCTTPSSEPRPQK